MTKDEIVSLQNDFINSVKLAKQANFDFVEIHGAHGYLISQFLSPLSNQRKDEYGGNVENRYRFLGEILKAIKNIDIDIHLRISANEYDEKGNSPDDIIKILHFAKSDGVVFNSISSGGIVPKTPTVYPGYQAELSREIKKSGLVVSAVGLLEDFGLCEYLLQSNVCDMIYQGRSLLKNPNWVYGAAAYFNEEKEIEYPLFSYSVIKY